LSANFTVAYRGKRQFPTSGFCVYADCKAADRGLTRRTARVLNAEGLQKRYGERRAVADVSLQVAAGEILGLLGPNGAGKSTTIGMISGLVVPDAGRITIAGAERADGEAAFKRRIGLVPQDLALYESLGALANLELFGALYGLQGATLRERALQALTLVGLADRAHEKPSSFSGGMKRRLNIASALVHDPDVLLLDEPTAGVDPQSRNAIFENLEQLKARGKALVYTTHYMEEVERLADRVVIIDQGRIVASGTLHELYRRLPGAQTLELDIDGDIDPAQLASLPGVKSARLEGGMLKVVTDDLAAATSAVVPALVARGCSIRRLGSERATLEDVFLTLTGHQLRD
jgi:ABC-2 type transport system ATP-binding protein